MLNILRLFFIGIAVGMANVIPGVSGGTLAVVFNVYDQFVKAITFNVKSLWQNRRFVFPMLGGMALGVLIFSKLISIFTQYYNPTKSANKIKQHKLKTDFYKQSQGKQTRSEEHTSELQSLY